MAMRTGSLQALVALAVLSVLAPDPTAGQGRDRAALTEALDSAALEHVKAETVAGVSVAVVHAGDTLLLKGYGLADLEWGVETPFDASASYEIGSVTKQFTAAAILMLAERGQVNLDADIRDYLPEFDSQGHAVSVRRLLDHTSGMKGYTEMPVFGELASMKLPRDTMISLVEAEPFEFEPGTALIYNNSAYFFLGLIIEEVSGRTYEDFVKEELFEPLGMEGSYYCSETAIRPNRAHGYDANPEGLIRKRYLDHTWPYAAGSLCSTAGDLVRWNQALHHGGVLAPESYESMITPAPLNDGTPVRYAKGLAVVGEGRHRVIAHGGGINGYLSDARYYPEEDLVVVVLQNSTGPLGPAALSQALAELVLGPAPEPEAVPFSVDLDELVGRYTGPARGRTLTMEVTRDGNQLVFTTEGASEGMRPIHVGDLTWAEGNSRVRFVRRNGRVVELRMDQVSGHYVLKREEG